MAVAYFIFHAKANALFPLLNGGEPAVLFSFIFLYFAAAGGGSLSLDNELQSRRQVIHQPGRNRHVFQQESGLPKPATSRRNAPLGVCTEPQPAVARR
nr:DoxX family protein [Cardiobacterium valvarum]